MPGHKPRPNQEQRRIELPVARTPTRLLHYAGGRGLNGSKEILIAARAGPDSGCRYMADILVYRLDAETGKILQTYKAHEAHRIFGDEDLPAVDHDDDEL